MAHYKAYTNCTLCPRKCGINRYEKTGFCLMGALPEVNLYMLHHGEEPPVSGALGTEPTGKGERADADRLADIYLELQDKGAYNINLVTPMHFTPVVADSIRIAKCTGLSIPVAVNTGGYEEEDTLKMLDGLVDIYMPDLQGLIDNAFV